MKYYLLLFICLLGGFVEAQQTDIVDFKHCNADLAFKFDSKEVIGKVTYTFDILKPTDSIFIDAQSMTVKGALLNNKNFTLSNDGKKIWIKHHFETSTKNTIYFEFSTTPKKALYFLNTYNSNTPAQQIWTQGQGKYTSNWLPSIDDMNDKIEFDLSIAFPKNYQVIANGTLKSKKELGYLDYDMWYYDMKKPMSSYLVAMAIGKYGVKTETSKSGIPIELYYYPEDSLRVEPTYRYSKRIFDFLENEISVPYPWQNYKQVPVKDFLYSGMENTSLTIFSDDFMIDETAFTDKNYVSVNAHELAHQWFGDLVTETSGTHHWLQEGFATYYALLAEKDIFGDDYYYWKLYESAQQLLMQDKAGQGTSLLDPKSSSLTFYQRGAWVLHILKEKVGAMAFKKAVKAYLERYKFKNVETNNFINEVEKASGQNLKPFVNTWLVEKEFPFNKAMASLKKNSVFIQEYLIMDCAVKTSKCNYYIDSGASDETRAKIIAQVPDKITKTVFKSSIQVRQAIAKALKTIPPTLKANYESLLNDESYITKEVALYNLWTNFPDDRKKYLEQTKAIIGFNDKNVRLLWLILALNTEDYQNESKTRFYDELVSYTASLYSVETRQKAFSYLNSIDAFNKLALINLVEVSNHHVWRFKKFGRDFIKRLSVNEKYKLILDEIDKK